MAAGGVKEQVETNDLCPGCDQAIQHQCMGATGPWPLTQLLKFVEITEVGVGSLLQAEIINCHDEQLFGHSSWTGDFLGPVGKPQLSLAQLLLSD